MKIIKGSSYTQSGFTLIELIMAITISTIIVSTIYSCLSHIMRTKVMVDNEREIGYIANSVIERLTRELQLIITDGEQKLLPPKNKTSDTYAKGVTVIGEKDSIVFLANDAGQYVHDGITHSGAIQITYRVATDPEENKRYSTPTYSLIRDETPFSFNYENAYKNTMTFPITSRLIKIQFSYFDEENNTWKSQWTKDDKGQPRLIRFNLQLLAPNEETRNFTTTVPIGNNL